jgi:hypothetical protein
LDTFLPPHAVPPLESALGAHLLPLRFLTELLRLGQRCDREAIDALLLRLGETPALAGFLDWMAVAADFLCGMEEVDRGMRVPASLPMPTNDCSQAIRAALLRILHASAAVDPAIADTAPVQQPVGDRATEPENCSRSPSLHPPEAAGGENDSSLLELDAVADVVIATVVPESVVSAREADEPAIVAAQPSARPERYVFRREGDWWRLCFGAKESFFNDCRGLDYLARLLARPNHPMRGVDLNPLRQELGVLPELTSDARARRECEQRFAELCQDMEDARRRNSEVEIREIQEEMRKLRRLVGSKRDRLGNSPQRATWRAVKSAIRRTIEHVRPKLPELAAHLDKTIQLKYEPAIYSPCADPQDLGVHWET